MRVQVLFIYFFFVGGGGRRFFYRLLFIFLAIVHNFLSFFNTVCVFIFLAVSLYYCMFVLLCFLTFFSWQVQVIFLFYCAPFAPSYVWKMLLWFVCSVCITHNEGKKLEAPEKKRSCVPTVPWAHAQSKHSTHKKVQTMCFRLSLKIYSFIAMSENYQCHPPHWKGVSFPFFFICFFVILFLFVSVLQIKK